jgi:hypothetical protein
MGKLQGFFELQEPEDLLDKLEYDYRRLLKASRDIYAFTAFDFFVTAYHVLDWLYPGNENENWQKRKDLKDKHVILRICDNIASGVKHFKVEFKRHTYVQHADYADIAPQSNDFQENSYFIELDGEAAERFGPKIKCEDLAEKVLDFWQNHFSANNDYVNG